MLIEKASEEKTTAENQIVDILNRLEKATGCRVVSIEIKSIEEEGFGSDPIITLKNVNINLQVP
jgi:hypothetical protein